jgi:arsenate reductase
MKATIWHNPNCGTSRKTLAILEETPGVELTVVEYLKNPPAADKLAQLYRDAGITPQQGLRIRGTDAVGAACRKRATPRCSPRWQANRS